MCSVLYETEYINSGRQAKSVVLRRPAMHIHLFYSDRTSKNLRPLSYCMAPRLSLTLFGEQITLRNCLPSRPRTPFFSPLPLIRFSPWPPKQWAFYSAIKLIYSIEQCIRTTIVLDIV